MNKLVDNVGERWTIAEKPLFSVPGQEVVPNFLFSLSTSDDHSRTTLLSPLCLIIHFILVHAIISLYFTFKLLIHYISCRLFLKHYL